MFCFLPSLWRVELRGIQKWSRVSMIKGGNSLQNLSLAKCLGKRFLSWGVKFHQHASRIRKDFKFFMKALWNRAAYEMSSFWHVNILLQFVIFLTVEKTCCLFQYYGDLSFRCRCTYSWRSLSINTPPAAFVNFELFCSPDSRFIASHYSRTVGSI